MTTSLVMSLDDIDGVLSETRSKTNAAEYLREFLASGELGREIDLQAGSFIGKSCKQVKTALDIARKKVSDETGNLLIPGGTDLQVRIKEVTNGKKGDEKEVLESHVFIINTRLVAAARAAQNGDK
jgi:hypothetical protein